MRKPLSRSHETGQRLFCVFYSAHEMFFHFNLCVYLRLGWSVFLRAVLYSSSNDEGSGQSISEIKKIFNWKKIFRRLENMKSVFFLFNNRNIFLFEVRTEVNNSNLLARADMFLSKKQGKQTKLVALRARLKVFWATFRPRDRIIQKSVTEMRSECPLNTIIKQLSF